MPHEILLQFTFKGHLINKQGNNKVFLVRAEFPAIKRSPCQAHMAIPFFLSFLPYMKLCNCSWLEQHNMTRTKWQHMLLPTFPCRGPIATIMNMHWLARFYVLLCRRTGAQQHLPCSTHYHAEFWHLHDIGNGAAQQCYASKYQRPWYQPTDIALFHQMTPVPYEQHCFFLLLPETLRASCDLQMNLRGTNLARRPITINFKSVRDSTMSQKKASSLFGITVGPLLCMQYLAQVITTMPNDKQV